MASVKQRGSLMWGQQSCSLFEVPHFTGISLFFHVEECRNILGYYKGVHFFSWSQELPFTLSLFLLYLHFLCSGFHHFFSERTAELNASGLSPLQVRLCLKPKQGYSTHICKLLQVASYNPYSKVQTYHGGI